jgi:hypothetical protein
MIDSSFVRDFKHRKHRKHRNPARKPIETAQPRSIVALIEASSLHAQRVPEESERGGALLQHVAGTAALCSWFSWRENKLLAAAGDAHQRINFDR